MCILARIIGGSTLPTLPKGFESVPTESLVPKELDGIASGADFVKGLPEFDAHFEQMRSDAQAENKVLRFVALIDVANGKFKAGLEKSASLYILSTVHLRHANVHTDTPFHIPLPRPWADLTISSLTQPSGIQDRWSYKGLEQERL